MFQPKIEVNLSSFKLMPHPPLIAWILSTVGTRYCNNLGWLWRIADEVSYLISKKLITANICWENQKLITMGRIENQENCGVEHCWELNNWQFPTLEGKLWLEINFLEEAFWTSIDRYCHNITLPVVLCRKKYAKVSLETVGKIFSRLLPSLLYFSLLFAFKKGLC